MAASAERRRLAADVTPSGQREIPMLSPREVRSPKIFAPSAPTSSIKRVAIVIKKSSLARTGKKMTNSSPPTRTVRSLERADRRRMAAICRDTSSPAACPARICAYASGSTWRWPRLRKWHARRADPTCSASLSQGAMRYAYRAARAHRELGPNVRALARSCRHQFSHLIGYPQSYPRNL